MSLVTYRDYEKLEMILKRCNILMGIHDVCPQVAVDALKQPIYNIIRLYKEDASEIIQELVKKVNRGDK